MPVSDLRILRNSARVIKVESDNGTLVRYIYLDDNKRAFERKTLRAYDLFTSTITLKSGNKATLCAALKMDDRHIDFDDESNPSKDWFLKARENFKNINYENFL